MATIFANDPSVFAFWMHGAKSYPLLKAVSSLDIELPDDTSDEVYLRTLNDNLPDVFLHDPQIVFYLAGADPFAGDKLGRVAVSIVGLRARDEHVLKQCHERELRVAHLSS